MRKIAFLPLLLVLLLVGCGQKEYPAVALPDGMDTDWLGERLLTITYGSYVVEEVESSKDGDQKTTLYRAWSAEEDGVIDITVTGQDGALLEVRYRESIKHRIQLSEGGNEMRGLVLQRLFEDITFDKGLTEEMGEVVFEAARTENNGFAEAFIGDWTVRCEWTGPEVGEDGELETGGGAIRLQILSGDRTTN